MFFIEVFFRKLSIKCLFRKHYEWFFNFLIAMGYSSSPIVVVALPLMYSPQYIWGLLRWQVIKDTNYSQTPYAGFPPWWNIMRLDQGVYVIPFCHAGVSYALDILGEKFSSLWYLTLHYLHKKLLGRLYKCWVFLGISCW